MKIKQQKMIKAFLVEEFGTDKGSLLYIVAVMFAGLQYLT